jgi:L-ascorbate metabolism protein UlaG (beta-lactamase superfamily)
LFFVSAVFFVFNTAMHISRRLFLTSGVGAGVGLAVSLGPKRAIAQATRTASARLLRHATFILRYRGGTFLVDPMLGDPGVMPPINNSPNPRPNPLVPLPMPSDKVLSGIDAVLVTHTHSDHWDAAATKLVPKDATLFIQPPDAKRFSEWQFTAARPIETSTTWNEITISRTGGQHGRGEVGKRLAPVSGFVLKSAGAPTIYIAGDTVWCPEVAEAIQTHKPDIIIVFAGAAQFLEGGAITMDVDDVMNVCKSAPDATLVAMHMEAINHCVLTRAALRDGLERSNASTRVRIPADGEEVALS